VQLIAEAQVSAQRTGVNLGHLAEVGAGGEFGTGASALRG